MPLISLRGSASAVSFGFLSAQSKLYWVGLVGAAVDTKGYAGAYDSTGAFVVGGETYNGATYVGLILKFGPTGTVTWQKQAPAVIETDARTRSLAIAAGDSIYLGVQTYTGFSSYGGYYVACDASGVIIGSDSLRIRSSDTQPTCDSVIPPNTSGLVQVSGGTKINYLLSGASASREWAINSRSVSAAVYRGGVSSTLGGFRTTGGDPWVSGFSYSSGASSAQYVSAGSNKSGVSALALSVAGTEYYAGFRYDSSAAVTRFGTGGWSRRLAVNTSVSGLCVDADDFVYACAFGGVVFKYSAAGVLQWQRVFTCASGSVSLYSISIDAAGTVGVVGSVTVSGAAQMFIARIPSNGGATNTITVGGLDISYAASAYAENTASISWVSDSVSTSSASFSAGYGAATSAAASTVDVVRL